MIRYLTGLVLVICILTPFASRADSFEPHASYTVCFTPGQDCTQTIVDTINSAVNSIWVQAYSFTSRPIGKALVMAAERGVTVRLIFDKDALTHNPGTLQYFSRHHLPIWIDTQPAIAHNKVMIIDQTQVITGSFNFTRAAQQNNAENVLIIYDAGLASKYLANWQQRQRVSTVYVDSANEPSSPDWVEQLLSWLRQLWHRWFTS